MAHWRDIPAGAGPSSRGIKAKRMHRVAERARAVVASARARGMRKRRSRRRPAANARHLKETSSALNGAHRKGVCEGLNARPRYDPALTACAATGDSALKCHRRRRGNVVYVK